MSNVKDYTPTQDTQNVVNKFTTLDNQFKSAWDEFYQKHQSEFDQLDTIRESRNVALDEAQKMLRDEATRLDVNRYKSFKFGPFQVSKPFSADIYRAVEFANLAKTLGFDKKMKDEGVIATKIEINAEVAREFLKKNALEDKFATTIEPGVAKTPSITGPKAIPGFGQEVKSK